ncbi:MAG: hypothetical protein ACREMA_09330 [Longimicrobiales bacterium]
MKLRSRIRFRPSLRRGVFWIALGIMLVAGVTGLAWSALTREYGIGPIAAATVGIGALLVALAFALLEFTNPTFHPESHLFDWDDVDRLRGLARDGVLDEPTREWTRSVGDRITIVLPGRSPVAQGQSQPKTPAVKSP